MSSTSLQPVSPPAAPAAAAKTSAWQFPLSSLSCKYIMAITGLGLSLFVLVHMLGNLQVFLGREVMNRYAHFLKSNPELLWPARIILLVFFVAHLAMGLSLTLQNQKARPVGYQYQRHYEEANLASRTMILSGLVIFAFLIYHLLHFTLGVIDVPNFAHTDPLSHQADVYGMVIRGFSQPVIVITYIIAQIFLGLHLWHGVPSLFQSLGINRPRWARGIEYFGAGFTILVIGGNILIPLLMLSGFYPDKL
jgi:succinate dehydrogenase / fumarate reductase cytochrome b subunit